jgi:glycosyltransferase involved in cell wall biosynthesis
MNKSLRILFVGDFNYNPLKLFADQTHKLAKGFIKLGHDIRFFNYGGELARRSPFKSRRISAWLYKDSTDGLLFDFCREYQPDIIHAGFPRFFDIRTVEGIRRAMPSAIIIGVDGDPWPELHPERIEAARGFDILTVTNDGEFMDSYKRAGVSNCIFMPNLCDPDIDRRYEVPSRWESQILWIGTIEHSADKSDTFRRELVLRLAERSDCRLYGCCGRERIGGQDCLYAISGARIGVSVNAYKEVRLCHSDRLTRFLAGGTFVLSRRFPDCELLYKDGQHLRYFDSVEEFFDLAQWYLSHEQERKRIADAGMAWVHQQFNCERIAGYIIELIEHGRYSAPWCTSLSTAGVAVRS